MNEDQTSEPPDGPDAASGSSSPSTGHLVSGIVVNVDASPGAGVTQSIRGKLNFLDDSKWRRFSARRLELIDSLSLSSKKASEQDKEISFVANSLRQEYGFPSDTLPDFDKLVRAGIQSVRRNRKRSRLKYDLASTPSRSPIASHDTFRVAPPSPTVEMRPTVRPLADAKDRISITALLAPTDTPLHPMVPPVLSDAERERTTSLPPMSQLSLGSNFHDEHFLSAVDRLYSMVYKAMPLVAGFSHTSNCEFLGSSLLAVAAAHAVERRLPHSPSAETVRTFIMSVTVLSAVVRSMGVVSLSNLHLALAACCREFGFDPVVLAISNLYYELLTFDTSLDLSLASSYETLATRFPSRTASSSSGPAIGNYYGLPSAPSSTVSSLSADGPSIRPVTLRFGEQKFEFTFSPRSSSPPTVAEVIDNGRNAFSINESQQLHIRNLNKQGRVLATDADVAETFGTEPRIDIELAVVRPDRLRTTASGTPKFQQLI